MNASRTTAVNIFMPPILVGAAVFAYVLRETRDVAAGAVTAAVTAGFALFVGAAYATFMGRVYRRFPTRSVMAVICSAAYETAFAFLCARLIGAVATTPPPDSHAIALITALGLAVGCVTAVAAALVT